MSIEIGERRAVTRARVAVTGLFFLFGIDIGIWAAHIPVVQDRLGLDPAVLGLALLAAAAGTLIAQPVLGIVMAQTGSRLPTMVAPPFAAIAMPLAIAAPSVPLLFLACFFIGTALGAFNVSMNTQASEIEVRRGKPTMSTFHAAASLGMLAGAALGSFVIANGWGNGLGAAVVAAANVVLALCTVAFLLRDPPRERGPTFVLPNRAVFGLGVLALLMFLVEGGMVDWSALLLAREKGAEPALAAAGFAVFTAAMVVMRIFGDTVVTRLGRRRTVAIGGGLVAIGVLVAVLAPHPLVASLAFALVGLGAANIVPVLISTAAQTPGVPPSIGIGAVVSMMTLGFLVGPPLIGLVASQFSLSIGFGLLVFAGLAVAVAGLLRTWPAAAPAMA